MKIKPIIALLSLFLISSINAQSVEWTFVGPQKETPMSHLAFYQNSKNPNIMLVASRGEKSTKGGKNQGLWRSEDGGKTWKLIDPKIGFMINNNQGMTSHPSDSNYVYLTQEYTPDFCWSSDAGKTWNKTKRAGFKHGICLGLHPTDKNIMFIGSDDGVWKSSDAGKSWKPVKKGLPPAAKGVSNTVVGILINPVKPNIMYTGFLYADMKTPWGVYKSVDGGDSWKAVNNGLPEGELILDLTGKNKPNVNMKLKKYGLQYRAVKDIQIDKLNPDTIYAVTRQNGLFQTNDAGANWKCIYENDPKAAAKWGKFFTCISVHPKYSNVLFLGDGGMNVHISTDTGKTWKALGAMVKIKDLGGKKVEVTLPNGKVVSGNGVSPAMGHHYMSSVHKVHVDVENERRIFVETDQGLFSTELPAEFKFK